MLRIMFTELALAMYIRSIFAVYFNFYLLKKY